MNEPNPYSPPPSTPSSEPQRETVSDTANQAWETTKQKAGEAVQTGERYFRDNPGTSLLGIFGLGCLVGFVIGWSIAHEQHATYAERAAKWVKRWGDKLNID